ncbi:MAG: NAD(P)-dependent oxidoreductase [Alphaproteobacteria bacterium]|nr:NAD(P)-dependent oxidoreductase [Alphaproteobacteria bacterium]
MQSYDRKTPIAFVGLGVMGAGMARRLLDAGYALTVCDLSEEHTRAFAALGATVAASPSEAVAKSRILFLSLPETTHVESVLFGTDGAVGALAPGSCVFDTSTISATAVREFARRLKESGIEMLDAPVSGGKDAAAKGTLTCMVGGPKDVFEACREIASFIATRYLHMGEHGAGQIAKCCNQVAVANAMMGVVEALTLARKQGVDPALVREALLGGAAKSFSLEKHGQRIIDHDFVPGFSVKLMRKDLNLATQAGHDRGAVMLGAHVALQLLETLYAQGEGDRDWSVLGALVERLSGIDDNKS